MLEWSVDALRAVPDVEHIVVALPPGVTAPHGTTAVAGGAERSHSVLAALRAAPPGEVVVVQDAARPLVTRELVEECLDVLEGEDCDAAIAAAPVADTIKEGAGDIVVRTLDRSRLWAVQTPQVFAHATLTRVHARIAAGEVTDDLVLVETAGGRVRVIPGERRNFKVTYPEDLAMAEALLAAGGVPRPG